MTTTLQKLITAYAKNKTEHNALKLALYCRMNKKHAITLPSILYNIIISASQQARINFIDN